MDLIQNLIDGPGEPHPPHTPPHPPDVVVQRAAGNIGREERDTIGGVRRTVARGLPDSGESAGTAEDGNQHLLSELAGGSILLAGVVRADEDWLAGGDLVMAIVSEDVGTTGTYDAASLQNIQISIL